MDKNKTQNKRAFTLTELLIVVIVIGVLSAVTLPKFNRVIENRKVTEAEEMMSAVRTEQERRCTLDQNYTTNFDSLSDVIASANTKNYTYSLQSQGISAKSNSGDYTLKILSYEDGSYCCTGAGCKKLNKNYPDCAGLSFPTSNCAGTEGAITPPGTEPTPGEPETPECSNGAVQGSQSCNGCGTQTTQKCVGGKWVASLGECSKTVEECASECAEGTVSGSQTCNGCGTQTTQKCVGGKWVASLGECSKTVEECASECAEGTVSGSQTCNGCGTQTTQKCVGGKWVASLGECSKTVEECSTCTEGETRKSETSCGSGCGVVLEACIKGKWQGVNCVPKTGAECTPTILSQETCPDGSYRRRTCNTATCKWGDWDKECPGQDCSNAAYKASHKAECCPGTPNTDTVCWTPGPLYWSTMQSATNNDAIFRCSQKNMYTPHSTCATSCTGEASVSNSHCASVSGPCSNYLEVCEMQITYCPIFTGTYNYGKPNCNCKGGEVLNRTFKQCVRNYLKNGW